MKTIVVPIPDTLLGKRDRAILALLISCGMCRAELVRLEVDKSKEPDFVVIPTPELRDRMAKIHGTDGAKIQSYLCTVDERCWRQD